MPSFWDRPEMSGMLRDVRLKPDKHEWPKYEPFALPAPPPPPTAAVASNPDAAILQILAQLER
jgi:type IV secretion system protein VirD4